MAMVINTNNAANNATRLLDITSRDNATTMARLTSGLRINGAADDAAGLAIATKMTSQIMGTDQAVRNLNDGMSIAQTMDGATGEVTAMLQRMRELGIQSMNETYSDTNRAQMNQEYTQLVTEIDRVANTTNFNGIQLLNSAQTVDIQAGWQTSTNDVIGVSTIDLNTSTLGTVTTYTTAMSFTGSQSIIGFDFDLDGSNDVGLQAGASGSLGAFNLADQVNNNATLAAQGITATVSGTALVLNTGTTNLYGAVTLFSGGSAATDAVVGGTLNNSTISGGALNTTNISTAGAAKTAVGFIDSALDSLSDFRAKVGAVQNRMEYSVSNLNNVTENMTAARSQIQDADFARESANLARQQVLQQAGMSMLSQANQQSQNVLSLLR
jgi:flagellin